jgi:hypothetical protein
LKAKYHTTHPHRQGPNGEPPKLLKRRKTKREGRAPDTVAVIEARRKQRLKQKLLSLEGRVRKLASKPPLKSKPTRKTAVKAMDSSQIEKNMKSKSPSPMQRMQLRPRKKPAKPAARAGSDSSEQLVIKLSDDDDLITPVEDSRRTRGVKWKSNSCPLDSSLEAIYQTLYPFLPIIQDPLKCSKDTVTFSAMHLLDNRRRWEDEAALDDQEFSSKITEAKIQLRSLMIAKGTLLNDKELVDYGVRHLALYLHSLILYRAGLTGRQNRRKVSNGSF